MCGNNGITLNPNCPIWKPFCCRDGWKITLVGSHFTHIAESRYAPIEGEALAVADVLDKARYFVLSCSQLIVVVDHKPLLKVFGDRSFENISNSRLRNLKEKTLRYIFRIVHIPGVKHQTPDCSSRHPTGEPEKMFLVDDIASFQLTMPVITYDPSLMHELHIPAPEPLIDDTVEVTAVASLVLSAPSLGIGFASLHPVTLTCKLFFV